jgi:hypothetical protein
MSAIREATDIGHPAMFFSCGSKKTLDRQDIPEIVKKFYDEFYAKSKTTIVSIANNEQIDFDAVKRNLLAEEANSIMPSNPKSGGRGSNMIGAPYIRKDFFVFVNPKGDEKMSYNTYIDSTPKEYAYWNVLLYHLENNLRRVLVHDEGLSDQVGVSASLQLNYIEINIGVYLSIEGQRRPISIVHYILKAIDNLKQYTTLEHFNEAVDASTASSLLTAKPTDLEGLVSQLATNYKLFGVNEILTGGNIPKEYDERLLKDLANKLQNTNAIYLFEEDYDTDTIAEYNLNAILKTRLNRDDNFGTKTDTNSMLKLSKFTSDLNMPYYSFSMDRKSGEELITILMTVGPKEEGEVIRNRYVPSKHFMTKLSYYSPSMSFRRILSDDKITYVEDDKYPVPVVNFLFMMNEDTDPTQNSFCQLGYYSHILSRRLLDISQDTAPYYNSIGIELSSTGIHVSLHLLEENAQLITREVLSRITSPRITQVEHEFALKTFSQSLKDQSPAHSDAIRAMKRMIFPHIVSMKEVKSFVQQ